MLTNSTNCNKIILYNINGNNSFEYLFKKLNIDYNNITIPTSNKVFHLHKMKLEGTSIKLNRIQNIYLTGLNYIEYFHAVIYLKNTYSNFKG